MAQNDPQWGGGRRGDGPPDLDELWRDFNRRLSGLFRRGRPGGQPPSGGGGDGGPSLRGAGAGFGVLKAKLPSFVKAGIAGAAVVVIAMMLSIDAKFWGVVVMGGAVIILFFLPWLDHSPVKSIRYRPDWHKYLYGVFVIIFLILGYLGVQPPSPIGERVSQVGTLFYFGFFLLMPWWSRIGETKPVPDRVTFVAH